MYAVKGNKEVKILDINKDEYLKAGYTILDEKFKVVERPANATINANEYDKIVAEKDKKIKELEEKVKELEEKIKKESK